VTRRPHARIRTRRTVAATAVAAALALQAGVTPAGATPAGPPGGRQLQARPLRGARVHGATSPVTRLARTDGRLLRLRSPRPVSVLVKLDYDALASYGGGVSGLPATSPSVTGRQLDGRSEPVLRYRRHLQAVESAFLAGLARRLPAARAGRRLRTVYGGVAVRLPGNRVADLLRLPGVVAVQPDRLERPLTDASPGFVGAPTVYRALGSTRTAGRGVIVGVLDTGAWPEHPSLADRGGLPAPPPKADGTPRSCDFGDNPLTPASDPFPCDHKLISGQAFLETYDEVIGGERYPYSARDSNGHGTFTATAAAGGPVAHASTLGVDRGAVHGIAPGAQVAVYKVCGAQGCFDSDAVAAIGQAILDGVQVINFSVSGGQDPLTDPVELAFLDAYAAGVLVAAAAGNDGPDPGTVGHRGPWVTTVAASTQRRGFESTVTLRAGAAHASLHGTSITAGVATPTRVVRAAAPPYADATCSGPAPAGSLAGRIVACRAGGAAPAVEGRNVLHGGAAGMLLYDPPGTTGTGADNHWLPAVHLDGEQGAVLRDFLAAHPHATASFTAGRKVAHRGDVLAGFSSRGPGGDWLKPDLSAPGVQVLAGTTPTPEAPELGPPGERFQVMDGTSAAAPLVAGAAALLLDLHPHWTPGQVKSALETTASGRVVGQDGTRAGPFEVGGGRLELRRAGDPGLTLDQPAAGFAAAVADALHRVDLNLPSVDMPVMPGRLVTTRTARNVSGRHLRYRATAQAPAGTTIRVTPRTFGVAPGVTVRLRIEVAAPEAAPGQYLGTIRLDQQGGPRDLHLPVAFVRQQGDVTLDQQCSPATVALRSGEASCQVTVSNHSALPARVVAGSRLGRRLRLTAVDGAGRRSSRRLQAAADLAASAPATPTVTPGASPGGYLPLDQFGISPIPIGDEEAVNFDVPSFSYAGRSWTTLGVTSDGYAAVGGAGTADISAVPQHLPDPARPNGVLAPFWTDLDGSAAPGVLATLLSDGQDTWIVVEWRLDVHGHPGDRRVFELWIGTSTSEHVSFAYDPAQLPAAPPAGFGLTVGAENADGTAGDQTDGPPTGDLRVSTTPASEGGSLSYSFRLRGVARGVSTVRTWMRTPLVRGVTQEVARIRVS
jgi:Subtilase family/Fibronectin type-III domain/PA domain